MRHLLYDSTEDLSEALALRRDIILDAPAPMHAHTSGRQTYDTLASVQVSHVSVQGMSIDNDDCATMPKASAGMLPRKIVPAMYVSWLVLGTPGPGKSCVVHLLISERAMLTRSCRHLFRMRHPNGITELEDQLARHFRLPHPGGRPEDFQKYIYLTQVTPTSRHSVQIAATA